MGYGDLAGTKHELYAPGLHRACARYNLGHRCTSSPSSLLPVILTSFNRQPPSLGIGGLATEAKHGVEWVRDVSTPGFCYETLLVALVAVQFILLFRFSMGSRWCT